MPENTDTTSIFDTISPKAVAAFLLPFAAALLLYLITGDDTYLVGLLLAVASGGAAVVASPAPGVKQAEVAKIASAKRRV